MLDDDNGDRFGCDGLLVLGDTGAAHVVGMGRWVGCSIPLEKGNKDLAVVVAVVVVADVAVCPVNWEDKKWKTRNIVDHILEAMMVNEDVVPMVDGGEVQLALDRKDDTPLKALDIPSSHVNRTSVTI